ncbi:unnamed protein product [Bursaphelenchus xylophilus]|uniref:(pine wood nematode) hypothetical protein n=1 Tax=Bursaphelenchus xylophilus TaxID=6326 RepID=A0A1I7SE46_BURXY|nr:unnamed protein product [Bursaphelenchus xylophilus]CAG9104205.1 unnamed protein product [Bursaphelenchus xylophilus]
MSGPSTSDAIKILQRENQKLRQQLESLSAAASSSYSAQSQLEEEAQHLRETLDEARRTRRILTQDNDRCNRDIQALREALRQQQRASAEEMAQLEEQVQQLAASLRIEEDIHRQTQLRLEASEALVNSLRHNLDQEMRRPHKIPRQPCLYCSSPHHNPLDCTTVTDRAVRRQLIGDRCVNCLGSHDITGCPSRKTCLHCQAWHHTSLCPLGDSSSDLRDVPGPSRSSGPGDRYTSS